MEKDKLNHMETIESFKDFFEKLADNFDKVPEATTNDFVSIYLDYVWACSSQFNNFLLSKEEGSGEWKTWMAPDARILETLLSNIKIEHVESFDELL